MLVLKAPAGFDPTWPALPVDPPACHLNSPTHPCRVYHHQNDTGECCYPLDHLAALLGPKDCNVCRGNPMKWLDLMYCPKCKLGKVPQRVALAIETPCDQCESLGWNCPACLGRHVRLRAEYTAQVDAVYPIEDRGNALLTPSPGSHVYIGHLLALADWSPGRVAVLISDVRRYYRSEQAFPGAALRPFDGPVAELSEVLL